MVGTRGENRKEPRQTPSCRLAWRKRVSYITQRPNTASQDIAIFIYTETIILLFNFNRIDTNLSCNDSRPFAVDVKSRVFLEPLLEELEGRGFRAGDFLPRLSVYHRNVLVTGQCVQVEFARVDAGSALLPCHLPHLSRANQDRLCKRRLRFGLIINTLSGSTFQKGNQHFFLLQNFPFL